MLEAVIIFLYLSPALIAFGTAHPSPKQVLFINVLLGWTGVGWLAALAQALNPAFFEKASGNTTQTEDDDSELDLSAKIANRLDNLRPSDPVVASALQESRKQLNRIDQHSASLRSTLNRKLIPGELTHVRQKESILALRKSALQHLVLVLDHCESMLQTDRTALTQKIEELRILENPSELDSKQRIAQEDVLSALKQHELRITEILQENELGILKLAELDLAWGKAEIIDGRIPDSLEDAIGDAEELLKKIEHYTKSDQQPQIDSKEDLLQ